MTTSADIALPGQAGELTSVNQLDADEGAAIRLRRARRVLNQPQKLASLDPAEQLRSCLDVLLTAEAKREGTVREAQLRAGAVFFDVVGPYLIWARDNGLYCLDDPARTFEQWLDAIWGYSVSQGYLFMDAVRVRAALGLAGSDDYEYCGVVLTTKHIRALAPAVNAGHPPELLGQVWAETAARESRVTEPALRQTYRQLTTASEQAAEDSNKPFDSSDRSEESNENPNLERWKVNEALRSIVGDMERLQERYSQLAEAGVAPLDEVAAGKDAARVRALGRWFGQHAAVPAEVVEAEIVD